MVWPLAIQLACVLPLICTTATAPSIGAPVSVFPIPGSTMAAPQTQITFRGLPPSQIGTINVAGSHTGSHEGSLIPHSDGHGASFVTSRPFVAGEVVTVSTSLNILGTGQGSWQFRIAVPTRPIPGAPWPRAPRVSGDIQRFHSRHDLVPPALSIRRAGRAARGDFFVAPQFGPIQDGPEILDGSGRLVWFQRMKGNNSAANFTVQSYRGQPVLTYWQGVLSAGVGQGEDVIFNNSYNQIATVRAGNGLNADLHEFKLTPQGTALITAYYPMYVDASNVHGGKSQIVLDSVVQEIDIPTGLVMFQWDSLDHVPLTDSFQHLPPAHTRQPYDYFHVSSVDLDRDGSLIISGRNVWTAYKVDHSTGRVLWNLGGKHSSFKMVSGAGFAFQHDVRIRASDDSLVSVVDNGAGQWVAHKQTRALKLQLDLTHMTARAVGQRFHSPALLAHFEGDYQMLDGGNEFVGWGEQPYITEYDSRGRVVLDGRFVSSNASYRAFRLRWSGTPSHRPAAAASTSKGRTTVYASWNGATNVAYWRVLGGNSPKSLGTLATAHKRSFETAIGVKARRYIQVQALDPGHHVLSTSVVVRG